jgi:hypothetical protein
LLHTVPGLGQQGSIVLELLEARLVLLSHAFCLSAQLAALPLEAGQLLFETLVVFTAGVSGAVSGKRLERIEPAV